MRMLEPEAARRSTSMPRLGKPVQRLDPDSVDACLGTLQWSSVPEEINDDVAMSTLLDLWTVPENEELYILTDASFGAETGVFVLPASDLLPFFAFHLESFAERVFSGGDVIIWTATKKLWVAHHEGVFAQMRSSSR